MAIVKLPTPLRPMAGGQDEVKVSGRTVREVIDSLEAAHPGLKARFCDDQGALRRFINLYVGEEDVRSLQGLDTEVKESDLVSIIPAIAGGLQGVVRHASCVMRPRTHPSSFIRRSHEYHLA